MEAFEELLERMRGRLTSLLRYYRIPPHDAQDILQEVFLALLGRWHSVWTEPWQREAWLLRATTLRSLDYLRRARRRRWEEYDEEAAPIQELARLDPPQLHVDHAHDLAKLLSTLEPRARQRLWLRLGLELSPAEVAARTGCRPSSVRQLIGRTLRKLRQGRTN